VKQNMSIHLTTTVAVLLASAFALSSPTIAGDASEIKLPGDRAYPESIAGTPDGTLFVSSPAVGGVWRIKPQSGTVDQWVKPGSFGTRSTLGVWSTPRPTCFGCAPTIFHPPAFQVQARRPAVS
jgi:hypothetical protein